MRGLPCQTSASLSRFHPSRYPIFESFFHQQSLFEEFILEQHQVKKSQPPYIRWAFIGALWIVNQKFVILFVQISLLDKQFMISLAEFKCRIDPLGSDRITTRNEYDN